MPLIHIYSDGVLEHVESRIRFAPQWIPKLIQREIKRTGGAALKNMQSMLGRNYYTGALMRSVKAEYDSKGYRVTISPTAQRGRWDAGLILEFGTGPITHAPWAPIARWAGTKEVGRYERCTDARNNYKDSDERGRETPVFR